MSKRQANDIKCEQINRHVAKGDDWIRRMLTDGIRRAKQNNEQPFFEYRDDWICDVLADSELSPLTRLVAVRLGLSADRDNWPDVLLGTKPALIATLKESGWLQDSWPKGYALWGGPPRDKSGGQP
jgi:hypothetical protein